MRKRKLETLIITPSLKELESKGEKKREIPREELKTKPHIKLTTLGEKLETEPREFCPTIKDINARLKIVVKAKEGKELKELKHNNLIDINKWIEELNNNCPPRESNCELEEEEPKRLINFGSYKSSTPVPWILSGGKIGSYSKSVPQICYKIISPSTCDYVMKRIPVTLGLESRIVADINFPILKINKGISDELAITILMGHLGIGPRVFDVIKCDDYIYMIMEKIHGITLEQYFSDIANMIKSKSEKAESKDEIKKGKPKLINPFPDSLYTNIINIIRQMHRHHVSHGDIHAANIILTPGGLPSTLTSGIEDLGVKLIDFGNSEIWTKNPPPSFVTGKDFDPIIELYMTHNSAVPSADKKSYAELVHEIKYANANELNEEDLERVKLVDIINAGENLEGDEGKEVDEEYEEERREKIYDYLMQLI